MIIQNATFGAELRSLLCNQNPRCYVIFYAPREARMLVFTIVIVNAVSNPVMTRAIRDDISSSAHLDLATFELLLRLQGKVDEMNCRRCIFNVIVGKHTF